MSVNGTKPVAGGVGIVTVCLVPLSLSGFQEIVTGLNGVRLAGSFQTYSVAEREQSLTRALESPSGRGEPWVSDHEEPGIG